MHLRSLHTGRFGSYKLEAGSQERKVPNPFRPVVEAQGATMGASEVLPVRPLVRIAARETRALHSSRWHCRCHKLALRLRERRAAGRLHVVFEVGEAGGAGDWADVVALCVDPREAELRGAQSARPCKLRHPVSELAVGREVLRLQPTIAWGGESRSPDLAVSDRSAGTKATEQHHKPEG